MLEISLANRDMSLNHRSNLNRENFWHIDQSEQLMWRNKSSKSTHCFVKHFPVHMEPRECQQVSRGTSDATTLSSLIDCCCGYCSFGVSPPLTSTAGYITRWDKRPGFSAMSEKMKVLQSSWGLFLDKLHVLGEYFRNNFFVATVFSGVSKPLTWPFYGFLLLKAKMSPIRKVSFSTSNVSFHQHWPLWSF